MQVTYMKSQGTDTIALVRCSNWDPGPGCTRGKDGPSHQRTEKTVSKSLQDRDNSGRFAVDTDVYE